MDLDPVAIRIRSLIEEQSQKHFKVKILLPFANNICPRVTCEGETIDVTQPMLRI
jgi:hypothetical protein